MVEKIMADEGCGAGDGCSVNFTFVNDPEHIFYNLEMGPAYSCFVSQLDIAAVSEGNSLIHCNRSYVIHITIY